MEKFFNNRAKAIDSPKLETKSPIETPSDYESTIFKLKIENLPVQLIEKIGKIRGQRLLSLNHHFEPTVIMSHERNNKNTVDLVSHYFVGDGLHDFSHAVIVSFFSSVGIKERRSGSMINEAMVIAIGTTSWKDIYVGESAKLLDFTIDKDNATYNIALTFCETILLLNDAKDLSVEEVVAFFFDKCPEAETIVNNFIRITIFTEQLGEYINQNHTEIVDYWDNISKQFRDWSPLKNQHLKELILKDLELFNSENSAAVEKRIESNIAQYNDEVADSNYELRMATSRAAHSPDLLAKLKYKSQINKINSLMENIPDWL